MNDYWFITIVTIRLSLHVNDYYYYCIIIIIITIIIITIIITERAAREVYRIHGESVGREREPCRWEAGWEET